MVPGRKGSIHVQIGRRSHQLPSSKTSKTLHPRQISPAVMCGDLSYSKHGRCSGAECLPYYMYNRLRGDVWTCKLRFGEFDNSNTARTCRLPPLADHQESKLHGCHCLTFSRGIFEIFWSCDLSETQREGEVNHEQLTCIALPQAQKTRLFTWRKG